MAFCNQIICTSPSKDYFVTAQSWADDEHTAIIFSRNRYRIAFLTTLALCICLVIAIVTLTLLQYRQCVVIHERAGEHRVLTTSQIPTTHTTKWEQTQAELARYVMLRAGYHPHFFEENGRIIQLQSSSEVFNYYLKQKKRSSPYSPVNTLGHQGLQRVFIHSIMPLENTYQHQKNMTFPDYQAQINFTVTTEYHDERPNLDKTFTALIRWKYRIPSNIVDHRWRNWSGFQVTAYQCTPIIFAKN